MEKVFSPKRLQKEGKTQEALEFYKKRYHESLKERDSFLSSLYLDEVAQTLIISNKKLSLEQLHRELLRVAVVENLDQEAREQMDLDIKLTLRKRFPETFEETTADESEQAN